MLCILFCSLHSAFLALLNYLCYRVIVCIFCEFNIVDTIAKLPIRLIPCGVVCIGLLTETTNVREQRKTRIVIQSLDSEYVLFVGFVLTRPICCINQL